MMNTTFLSIQTFRHNNHLFQPNEKAELIYFGPIFCVIRLLK
jgi:hypothetical protein